MAKAKTGLNKSGYVLGKPKKLVKGKAMVQNTPRRLVMVPRKHIADKDGNA